ncbi:hypothetical protein LTR53_012351 [Teratosphaeriaceae sp. CCFEE 6253]|nr:hypothetical protein LTR53_012351 [Teratosphaeriaceae sp. CCFEE 6253]
MPWTHHAHSGQFCNHATDTLEDVVRAAVARRMSALCLTEHIARGDADLYPGEADAGCDRASQARLYGDFHREARRLQAAYRGEIAIFVGFEGEWIRSAPGEAEGDSLAIIQALLAKYPVDLFVGSVHHVHTHPIDYDIPTYHLARTAAGGTDAELAADYFDAQLAMLTALRPPVVGHFDLIRLKSDDPNLSFRTLGAGVWEKIERNLRFVAEYGGVLELNSSAIRKGLAECYPQVEILRRFRELGGRCTLSDDSHGVQQVGACYAGVLECVERAGLTELWCLWRVETGAEEADTRFAGVGWRAVLISELKRHAFWEAG